MQQLTLHLCLTQDESFVSSTVMPELTCAIDSYDPASLRLMNRIFKMTTGYEPRSDTDAALAFMLPEMVKRIWDFYSTAAARRPSDETAVLKKQSPILAKRLGEIVLYGDTIPF